MSTDKAEKPESAKRQPLTPAARQRFQKLFVHAGKQAAQDSFDYATELFTQCVLGDLDNIAYWQSFFANLKKKYDNNKKGAKMAGIRSGGDKASLKKAQISKDYKGVFKHGVEVLKLNPWDVSALLAMHHAGEELELDEVPLLLLRIALNVAPNDVHVNRAAGHALRLRKQFDQAIACWHRVEEASKGGDMEAQKQISELAVERTIDHGGYEGAETSRQVKVEDQRSQARQELSREEALRQAIRLDPTVMKNHVDLAEFYFQEERYEDAEKTLQVACEQSRGDLDILDRLEDAQLRNLRHQLRHAEEEAKSSRTKEAKIAWKRAKEEYDLKSLASMERRVKRFPSNLNYKFELGRALQLLDRTSEAIQYLQAAREAPGKRGDCLLRLGQCFQKIKQYQLAMSHFEQAAQQIPDRDADNKKIALYCAGRLALGLKDAEKAEKYLTSLAGIDFGYKDVGELLDKLAKLRDNG